MSQSDLAGMPIPSVWETLRFAGYILWELSVRFWPLLILGFGGRLLLWWLERAVARRRARRGYCEAIREREALLDDEWIASRPVSQVNYPADWDSLRRRVYRRARYRCQNCGEGQVELHAHHIVPLSVGGSNALSNLACLCRDCHCAIHPHMRTDLPQVSMARAIASAPPDQRYASDRKLRW